MKSKNLILIVSILFFFTSININAREVKDYNVSYKQTQTNEFTVKFQVNNYSLNDIDKDGVTYSNLIFENSVTTKKQGWAELPFLHASVQLPNNKNVTVEIVDIQYEDIDINYPMLPSRGVIYRNQDPSTIPYQIDPASIVDEWYPDELFNNTEPYILRDVRGENIYVYPFQYNSVQNKLRVYKNITLRVVENNTQVINPIANVNTKVAREMPSIYNSIFINYSEYHTKWTNEIDEYGEILVLYTSRDAIVIQPWITWKKEMGYTVHETQLSTGTNAKTTIQNAYDANNDILYVLIVGDYADISSDLGTTQNGAMDPMLGCVVGTDDYHDIIIGRFSASTTTHVTTQANKTIAYERDPETAGTWYSYGLGIGGNDGPGDDSEDDYEQVDVIKDYKLLPFTYAAVNEAYGSPTATTVANYVNAGLSVINYCGHGDHDYWVTSGYSNTNINASTNGNKLPFIFSVACIVGEFHTGGDCFGEAWLKKSDGGAIGAWMSSINQPWNPPMRGQDYANDVLTQGYNYSTGSGSGTSTTYGKTTFGSITFNAAALMISEASNTEDWDTYKTWIVFGDPSFQVRTETPKAITITNPVVSTGSYTTQITVGGSPFENALVSLYKAGDPQPFAGLTDASGNVTINHTLSGTIKLTVTGFNLDTYSQDVVVSSPIPPTADFIADQTNVTAGTTVNFTDTSTDYPTSWDWTFVNGTPGTSTDQNPSIQYNTPGVYNVTLIATNGSGSDTETKTGYITVTAVSTPPVADFVASSITVVVNQSIAFTDLSTNLPTSWDWTFAGGTPNSSPDQDPSNITYNTVGTYTVTLEATNGYGSDTETKVAYITVVEDPAFSLDFEDCINYSEIFDPWSLNDVDGKDTYASSDCDFPGETEPMSFMAFNPSDAGFSLASTHGGERCGMSICPADASASNDWLISDYITLGTSSSITFWVLSPKPGSWGNDSYKVAVSTTNNSPASFNVISGATAIEAPATWTQHTYDLSAYDGQQVYLGINHVSADKFMFFIDDIEINTTITAIVYPTAEFVANSTSICVGETVTFTNQSVDADTYEWTFAGGTPGTSTSTNPNITYNTPGTYQVQLIATNSTGGSDTEVKTSYIVVEAILPVDVTIAGNNTICTGETVVINASPTNEGTTPTYEWFINGSSVGNDNPIYTSTSLADGDIVTCELTSSFSCATGNPATSSGITMTVNPNLAVDVTIAGNNTICAGETVIINATPTNEGTTPTYEWFINGSSVGNDNPSYTSTSLADGDIITCELTSSEPCNDGPATSNSITMSVTATLSVDVTINASTAAICTGDNVDFTSTPTNGGATPAYQWQVNGSNVGTGSTYSSSILNDGDIVSCVLTSSEICNDGPATSNSIIMTVASSLPASVSITGNNSICAGETVVIDASPTNEGASPTYEWFINGSSVGNNNPTYTSTSLADGDIITCQLTSSLSCATGNPAISNTLTITVNSSLTVSLSIAGNSTICAGENTTFTASPTNGGTTPAYQWQVNGSNVGIGGTYSSTTLNDGDIVSCILTSSEPCNNGPATSNSITIDVTASLAVDVMIAGNNTICAGGNATFTASPANGGTTPAYQWQVNGYYVGTGSTYSSTTLNDGDIVSCILTSSEPCVTNNPATSNSLAITVNELPTANFVFSTNYLDVTFINTSTNAVSYFWNFGDGNTSTFPDNTHTYIADGTYDVTLIATNACGSDTTIITINIVGVSIADKPKLSDVEIYPNPSSGLITIDLHNNNVDKLEIVDVIGKLQYSKVKVNNVTKLDLSKLNKGVYFIKLVNEDKSLVYKIVLN